MKRIVFVFICMCALSILAQVCFKTEVRASSGWTSFDVKLISQKELPQEMVYVAPCSGRLEVVKIQTDGLINDACVYGEYGGLRVVRYLLNSSWQYRYAVSFPGFDTFFELRDICSTGRCAYSSEADMFLGYKIFGIHQSLALYSNFSERLERGVELSGAIFYRLKDPEKRDYELRNDGQLLQAGPADFSNNGEWIVIETYDYGYFRINTKTFATRQIADMLTIVTAEEYDGRQLAITNSGNGMVTSGRGILPVYTDISPGCGRAEGERATRYFENSVKRCSGLGLTALHEIPGVLYGDTPSFSDDEQHLSIVTHARDGVRFAVVLATADATAASSREPFYIALGDSFTSGEGEVSDAFYRGGTNTSSNRCHTSIRSYPYLVAQQWNIAGQNVACSGARTTDILNTKDVPRDASQQALESFTPGVVEQIKFIEKYQPSVVSIGIGGNDAGLMAKLKACLGPDTCEWAVEPAKRKAVAQEISQVYTKLLAVIRSVKSLSPSSRIAVVGYPLIINSTAEARCDLVTGTLLNDKERIFMNESIRYLNKMLWAAANTARVNYANSEGSFFGSTLCDQQSPNAMNGVRIGDDFAPLEMLSRFKVIGAESFHPTPYGHRKLADAFLSYFDTPALQDFCATCEMPMEVPAPSAYWEDASNTPVVRQVEDPAIVKNEVRIGEAIAATIGKLSLAPLTPFRIVLHSEPVELFTGKSDAFGAAQAHVTIPKSIKSGYHVMHILGEGVDGEPVDIYQTVGVLETNEQKEPQGDTSGGAGNVDSSIGESNELTDAASGLLSTVATPLPHNQTWFFIDPMASVLGRAQNTNPSRLGATDKEGSSKTAITPENRQDAPLSFWVLITSTLILLSVCIWWVVRKRRRAGLE